MTAYAEVIGDPIAQSKSPAIHTFWLGKLGIDAEYRAAHVRADELADYLASRRADEAWRGCNVTMPPKQAVMAHLARLHPLAERIGAVYTILRETERYAPAAGGGEPVTVGTWGSFQRIRHGALNELPGQWNTLEIIVRGDTATHIVNGFVNLRAWDFKQRNPAGEWVRLDHGKISLQAEFAEIYYRNIRIRPLTAQEMQ